MARISLDQMLGLAALFDADEDGGDYSANVMPPSRGTSRGRVTTEETLALPSAYRAIDIIAGMGWMLSLEAVRGLTTVPSNLIDQPDPWRSVESFLERTLVGMATDGNAFWLKSFFPGTSDLAGLEVLDPNHVHIRWKNGVKTYRVWMRREGKWAIKSSNEIVHLWYLEVPGHDRGLGPIAACRAALEGIIDLREYADGWFGDHASDVPSGVLSSDQHLDPEEVREYKRLWLNPTDDSGKSIVNGPSVRVMGKGLTYQPILLKPADAQWLESQGAGVLDIARMFGMPADYLLAALEGSSLTYTTLLMVDTRFMRQTMLPRYLRKIEVALSACLPRGQKARFNLGDFLKPDVVAQASVDEIYLRNDVVSRDEVRGRLGYDGPAPEPRNQPTPTEAPA